MKHVITPLLLSLIVLSGFRVSASAQIPISGTSSGSGTISLEPGSSIAHQEVNSEGVDTQFGAFTGHATADRDLSDPSHQVISNGFFTEIFHGGTLFGALTGTAALTGPNTGTFENLLVFTGGTGLFQNASGSARVTGTFLRTGATTFTTQSSYVGTLGLVPEPGALLLFSSLSLSYAVLFRLRRRRNFPSPS
jgi:hypothetical protein